MPDQADIQRVHASCSRLWGGFPRYLATQMCTFSYVSAIRFISCRLIVLAGSCPPSISVLWFSLERKSISSQPGWHLNGSRLNLLHRGQPKIFDCTKNSSLYCTPCHHIEYASAVLQKVDHVFLTLTLPLSHCPTILDFAHIHTNVQMSTHDMFSANI